MNISWEKFGFGFGSGGRLGTGGGQSCFGFGKMRGMRMSAAMYSSTANKILERC
jgi:hypothetical protein